MNDSNPWKSYADQLDQLIDRGMGVTPQQLPCRSRVAERGRVGSDSRPRGRVRQCPRATSEPSRLKPAQAVILVVIACPAQCHDWLSALPEQLP